MLTPVTKSIARDHTVKHVSLTLAVVLFGLVPPLPAYALPTSDYNTSCTTTGITEAADGTANNLICNGSNKWQYPSYIIGNTGAGGSAISCSATTAGAVQWTGGVLQYCSGTAWVTVQSSGSTSGIYLGTSASYTNPQKSTDITTGLYSANTGEVDVASGGNQITQTTANGFNVVIGSVGIGTNAPLRVLDVAGSSSGTTLTTASQASVGILNMNTTSGNYADLAFQTYDTSSAITLGAKVSAVFNSHTPSGVSADLAFLTKNAGTTSEKIRITAGGNLGIGSTIPVVSLDLSQKTDAIALPSGASSVRPTGTALANGEIRYNTSGVVEYWNGTTWVSLESSGSSSGIYLGASASATNPQNSTNAGTGLYSASTTEVDVAENSTQVASFTSTGINIGTGSLKIAGQNGISFPLDYTTDASIAIGSGALAYQPLGTSAVGTQGNVAVGYQALGSTGLTVATVNNTAVGTYALTKDASGYNNAAFGGGALYNNSSGNYNTAIGAAAMYANTSGASNTAIGTGVGYTTLSTGNGNLLIGVGTVGVAGGADTPASGSNNYLNIGNTIEGNMANANAVNRETLYLQSVASSVNYVQLSGGATGTGPTLATAGGDTNINLTISPKGTGNTLIPTGSVGIGTASPGNKLTVNGGIGISRVSNLAPDLASISYPGQTYGLQIINSSSTDPITMWTNGSARLSINSSGGTAIGTTYAASNSVGTNNLVVQGNVGIGVTSPNVPLQIVTNTTSTGIYVNAYGASPNPMLIFYAAEGTSTAPTSILSGDGLGSVGARGYGATGFSTLSKASMSFIATQSWTDSNQGAAITFSTTPNNSSTKAEVMRLDQSGNVGIGSTTPVVSLDLSQQKDAIALPSGVSGTRPVTTALANGEIRYNTGLSAVEYYNGSTWVSLESSGSSSGIYLGTSASYTNPSRNGDQTTGLYTANAGEVDVSSGGTQIISWTASGENIVTGSLKLAGQNGISFPPDFTPNGSIAIGSGALGYQTASATTAQNNTAVGYQTLGSSGLTTSAIWNTAIGYQVLNTVTSGNANTAEGRYALGSLTTGYANSAYGVKALNSNTVGSSNTAFGAFALGNGSNTGSYSGSGNTAVGYGAGGAPLSNAGVSGSYNTLMGYAVAETTLTTGSYNILIGVGSEGTAGAADTPGLNTNNYLNIGNTIEGSTQYATGIGSETLYLQSVTGSVNYVQLSGGATGTGPTLATAGGDTNVNLTISPKGSGNTLIPTGSVGIGSTSPVVSLDLSQKTDAIALPSGASSARPVSTALTAGEIRYNTSGVVEYYNGTTWASLQSSGSSSGAYLGASASATNPQNSSNAGTGLYSASTGEVDVAENSIQVASFTASGINIGTGSLKIAGQNGISFPADYLTDASIAIGSGALAYQAIGIGTQGNLAVGYQALGNSGLTTAAVKNTALGYLTGSQITSGYNNTIVGAQVASTTLSTGNSNILIGVGSAGVAGGAGVSSSSTSNFLNIGNTLEGNTQYATAIGSETLYLNSVSGSVNYVQLSGGATGTGPTIATAGTDTNVNLIISPKGTGSVGVGTTVPGSPLHIYSASATGLKVERSTAANSNIQFTNTNGSMYAGLASTYFGIGPNADLTSAPFIVTSASVGVGTAVPSSPLHIYSTSASGLKIERSGAFNSNIQYTNTNGSMYAGLASTYFGIGSSGDLASASFIVTSAGNIGIGSTTPVVSLDFTGRTDAIALPSGTSSTRPTGTALANGEIRYNTSGVVEFWNGTTWVSLASGAGTGTANYTARWTTSTALGTGTLYDNGTQVSIGNAAPVTNATLDVTGTIYSRTVNANASTTINWASGNEQYTTASCGTFSFSGMVDGGSYTLLVEGTTSGTCSFSNTDTPTLTFRLPSNHGATTSGTMTLYHFTRLGTYVIATWMPGYAP